MNEINANDLINISRGAALLGSGGGGDTSILYQFAYDRLLNTTIPLRKTSDLSQNDLIVPIAYIGSPAVSKAAGPTEAMFLNNIKAIQGQYPTKNIILMPAEIGGCNALAPIAPAALLNLPILDADLLGRAFPKLKMCKPAVTQPNTNIEFYLSSREGETQFGCVANVEALEIEARKIAVGFGGSACIATYLFSGSKFAEYVIEGSLSRAYEIGCAENKVGSNIVSNANTINIQIENAGGFLAGYVEVSCRDEVYRIDCLNEFYTVTKQGVTLAASPDIISLIDVQTSSPIASESLVLGLSVNINVLPAPAFWNLENAKVTVTPNQFQI